MKSAAVMHGGVAAAAAAAAAADFWGSSSGAAAGGGVSPSSVIPTPAESGRIGGHHGGAMPGPLPSVGHFGHGPTALLR
jgi:hypothetical protein